MSSNPLLLLLKIMFGHITSVDRWRVLWDCFFLIVLQEAEWHLQLLAFQATALSSQPTRRRKEHVRLRWEALRECLTAACILPLMFHWLKLSTWSWLTARKAGRCSCLSQAEEKYLQLQLKKPETSYPQALSMSSYRNVSSQRKTGTWEIIQDLRIYTSSLKWQGR